MATTDRLALDYRLVTEACGVLDRSERGKLALTGTETKSFMQGQVTNDVEALTPGTGCYAAFLTVKGKMEGDLRILDTGEELWLDTERVSLQPLFNMIQRYKLGADVQLGKRTLEQGLLSLLGPDARRLAGAEQLPQAEHANRRGTVGGVEVLMVSTDAGVDLVCDAERMGELLETLTALGAEPVAGEAAECIRIERGRPRFGMDIDQATIPQEAGLNERAVSFTKGCYVGQETVARLFYRGKPNRHLRGLRLTEPASTGEALRLGDREVGKLGSVAVSPRLGPIALALIRREAAPGDSVAVGEAGDPADVVELPFPAA